MGSANHTVHRSGGLMSRATIREFQMVPGWRFLPNRQLPRGFGSGGSLEISMKTTMAAIAAFVLSTSQLAGFHGGQNTVANNIYQPIPTKQPKTITVKGGGATCQCGKGAIYRAKN